MRANFEMLMLLSIRVWPISLPLIFSNMHVRIHSFSIVHFNLLFQNIYFFWRGHVPSNSALILCYTVLYIHTSHTVCFPVSVQYVLYCNLNPCNIYLIVCTLLNWNASYYLSISLYHFISTTCHILVLFHYCSTTCHIFPGTSICSMIQNVSIYLPHTLPGLWSEMLQ